MNELLFKEMLECADRLRTENGVAFYTCVEVSEGLEDKYGKEKVSLFYETIMSR